LFGRVRGRSLRRWRKFRLSKVGLTVPGGRGMGSGFASRSDGVPDLMPRPADQQGRRSLPARTRFASGRGMAV